MISPPGGICQPKGWHVRSAGDLEDHISQIEGHGIKQELQFDLGQIVAEPGTSS